jgi:hypothetical protein
MRGADRAYRRSSNRGFFVLMVDLFSMVVLPTRRGGSRSPLAASVVRRLSPYVSECLTKLRPYIQGYSRGGRDG